MISDNSVRILLKLKEINFLINSDLEDVDNSSLLKGLKLVGDYLEKSILKPNNINYPKSRFDFISIIK